MSLLTMSKLINLRLERMQKASLWDQGSCLEAQGKNGIGIALVQVRTLPLMEQVWDHCNWVSGRFGINELGFSQVQVGYKYCLVPPTPII